MTQKQLTLMRDLLSAVEQGFKGVSIRKSERRDYVALEREGLVYFVSGFGRGGDCSVRLTEAGEQRARAEFAYGYENAPRAGQVTYQNQEGEVTLVEQRKAGDDYSRYLQRRGISETEYEREVGEWLDTQD